MSAKRYNLQLFKELKQLHIYYVLMWTFENEYWRSLQVVTCFAPSLTVVGLCLFLASVRAVLITSLPPYCHRSLISSQRNFLFWLRGQNHKSFDKATTSPHWPREEPLRITELTKLPQWKDLRSKLENMSQTFRENKKKAFSEPRIKHCSEVSHTWKIIKVENRNLPYFTRHRH